MISFGANTVKDLRKHTDFVLDCHLMVENPENLIPVISGHAKDKISHWQNLLDHRYRSSGIDRNSGFFSTLFDCLNRSVDGSINDQTAIVCKKAGADIFVSGSYIFGGNIEERIQKIMDAGEEM